MRKGTKHTEEWKKKMSEWHTSHPVRYWSGKTFSPEHIAKLSKARKGRVSNRKGSKLTEAQRLAMSVRMKGKGSPWWRGGTTTLRAQIRDCYKYLDWRKSVFEKDGYACTECGDSRGRNLQADHCNISFAQIIYQFQIKSIEDALSCSTMWDISNGRTLCITCHKATANYGKKGRFLPVNNIITT